MRTHLLHQQFVKRGTELRVRGRREDRVHAVSQHTDPAALLQLTREIIIHDPLIGAQQFRVITVGCVGLNERIRCNTVGELCTQPLQALHVKVDNGQGALYRAVTVRRPRPASARRIDQIVSGELSVSISGSGELSTREAPQDLLIRGMRGNGSAAAIIQQRLNRRTIKNL